MALCTVHTKARLLIPMASLKIIVKWDYLLFYRKSITNMQSRYTVLLYLVLSLCISLIECRPKQKITVKLNKQDQIIMALFDSALFEIYIFIVKKSNLRYPFFSNIKANHRAESREVLWDVSAQIPNAEESTTQIELHQSATGCKIIILINWFFWNEYY